MVYAGAKGKNKNMKLKKKSQQNTTEINLRPQKDPSQAYFIKVFKTKNKTTVKQKQKLKTIMIDNNNTLGSNLGSFSLEKLII